MSDDWRSEWKLRDYQETMVQNAIKTSGTHGSAIAVSPVGTGKTVMACEIIRHFRELGRTIILVDRKKLLFQFANQVKRQLGCRVDIDQGSRHVVADSWFKAPVVLTTKQTATSIKRGRFRMEKFDPHEFALLIHDECHHSAAAGYRRCHDYFSTNKSLFRLGITATPNRTDGRALKDVFATQCFDYRLPQAVEDGWLVPLKAAHATILGYDLSNVRLNSSGEFTARSVSAALQNSKVILGMADKTFQVAGERQTIMFCNDVANSRIAADRLNFQKPGCAALVHGGTPDEIAEQIDKDYKNRKFQFLVNCQVFTEGYDDPGTSLISVARPVKSSLLFEQMIGRGFRTQAPEIENEDCPEGRKAIIAASAKPHIVVLDFFGSFGRYRPFNSIDALAGAANREDVELAVGMLQASGEGEEVDVQELLAKAREERLEAYREAEKRKQEAAKKTVKLDVRAEYKIDYSNPFDVLSKSPSPRESVRQYRKRYPTIKMVETLMKFKVPKGQVDKLDFHAAGRMLDLLISRSKKGLCSWKMASQLKRRGLDPDMKMEEARKYMNQWFGGK